MVPVRSHPALSGYPHFVGGVHRLCHGRLGMSFPSQAQIVSEPYLRPPAQGGDGPTALPSARGAFCLRRLGASALVRVSRRDLVRVAGPLYLLYRPRRGAVWSHYVARWARLRWPSGAQVALASFSAPRLGNALDDLGKLLFRQRPSPKGFDLLAAPLVLPPDLFATRPGDALDGPARHIARHSAGEHFRKGVDRGLREVATRLGKHAVLMDARAG